MANLQPGNKPQRQSGTVPPKSVGRSETGIGLVAYRQSRESTVLSLWFCPIVTDGHCVSMGQLEYNTGSVAAQLTEAYCSPFADSGLTLAASKYTSATGHGDPAALLKKSGLLKAGKLARRFRLWEKKRGNRRTGSKLWGSAGEALFFAALFLFGSISLTALLTTENQSFDAWASWLWLVGLVLVSLVFIGAGGTIWSILMVGTTAERRRALAKRATDIDLLTDSLPSPREFPNVPRDVNLRNSPGIKLSYRLPISPSPGWTLLAVGVFSLLWNGMVSILIVLAIRKHMDGVPDWYLTALVIPFAAVGITSLYYLFRLLLVATAVGPTSLEVSDHPLYPGRKYRVYLTQAGRLSVKSLTLSLVCYEEATYQQGTDTRTERRRVHEQLVFSNDDFEIMPSIPYEHECDMQFAENVMHSFQSDHNAVQWRLVVRGTVDKWPEFERVFPLVVYPPVSDQKAQEQPAA